MGTSHGMDMKLRYFFGVGLQAVCGMGEVRFTGEKTEKEHGG